MATAARNLPAAPLLTALICLSMRPKFKALAFNSHSRYLTLFWMVALFSLILSFFSRYYFQYFNLLNLGIIFLGFHISRLFFQDNNKMIKKLFWGFAIVSALECFVGLWQFFAQCPLGLSFLGEISFNLSDPHLAVIPLTEKTRKLIELFRVIPLNQESLMRAYGTFLHPNIFSAYLALSLMVSYYLFSQAKNKLQKSLLISLVIAQIFCLCLTFSRAGMLSWAVGTALWFGIFFSKKLSLKKEIRKQMHPLLWTLGGAFAFSVLVLLPHFLARGGFFNYTSFVQSSDSLRVIYQNVALAMIKASPLTGIGYNCFIIAPSEFFPSDLEIARSWTHNIYLLIGSETGLIGLGIFLLFLASLMWPSFKHPFTLLSTTLFTIILGFLIVGLFDFYFLVVQSGRLMFFLFSGMLAAQLVTKAKVLPSPSQT